MTVCLAAVSALGWVVFGGLGLIAGIPAGVLLARWIGRLETQDQAKARQQISRDLPLATDLLAACVSVGRSPDAALRLVGRSLGGALGDRLGEISARLELGADPAVEWSRCAADPQLGPLGRAMARSVESGAPLADLLGRLADDCRRERRTASQQRARSVGVKAAGPLAICFLPAFMLVGVVPTVAGSFQRLFG